MPNLMLRSSTPRFGDLKTMNRFLVAAGFHAMAAASGGRGLSLREHQEALEANLRSAKAEPEFDFFLRKPQAIADEVVLLRTRHNRPPLQTTLQEIFRRPERLGFNYPIPNWPRHGFNLFIEALEKVGAEPITDTPEESNRIARYFSTNSSTLDWIEHIYAP